MWLAEAAVVFRLMSPRSLPSQDLAGGYPASCIAAANRAPSPVVQHHQSGMTFRISPSRPRRPA